MTLMDKLQGIDLAGKGSVYFSELLGPFITEYVGHDLQDLMTVRGELLLQRRKQSQGCFSNQGEPLHNKLKDFLLRIPRSVAGTYHFNGDEYLFSFHEAATIQFSKLGVRLNLSQIRITGIQVEIHFSRKAFNYTFIHKVNQSQLDSMKQSLN